MQRLIVDMDGVLADVWLQYQAWDERDTGRCKSAAEVAGIPELEAFARAQDYVRTPGFFRNAPVVQGSQRIMEQLNDRYELFVVSAALEFPQSLNEKMDWLAEHFPFISWQRIVLCGSKQAVRGEIMIDDHFKNLDFFEGRTILFTQPHNQTYDRHGHERVHSWDDVARLLL